MRAFAAGLSRITRPLSLLALGAAMVLTVPCSAQFGLRAGIGDAFRPALTTRDVQLAVDMLQLDDNQKFILETLFEDYQDEFRTGVDEFKLHMQEMSLGGGQVADPEQIKEEIFGTLDKLRITSQGLAEQLMTDLKELLTVEQLETWPSFERRLFRLKFLTKSRLSGEGMDLLVVVRDLNLDESQMTAIQPLLTQYEMALDNTLRQREDYMNRSEDELVRASLAQDTDASAAVARKRVDLRAAVRDVNVQYADAIAAALPEEYGQSFLKTVRERMHPRVYRTTQVQRLFKAAKELEGLSPEVLAAIEALEEQYLMELASINERLVRIANEQEPRKLKERFARTAQRQANTQPKQQSDPLSEKFAERREMGDRYAKQLQALLAAEQFASLPGARRWLEVSQRAGKEGGSGGSGGSGTEPRAIKKLGGALTDPGMKDRKSKSKGKGKGKGKGG